MQSFNPRLSPSLRSSSVEPLLPLGRLRLCLDSRDLPSSITICEIVSLEVTMDQDLSDRSTSIDSLGESVFQSVYAAEDVALNCDLQSIFWKEAHCVALEFDTHGRRYDQHFTQVRSRWTRTSLYILFICQYEVLYLKPQPVTDRETFGLWDWDVAELFIGCDFHNISHYKEFEVSPQGEWVDLEVNLELPDHTVGWQWTSGCEIAARIDQRQCVWYGAMRIPYSAIDSQAAAAGRVLRVNFCRSQGPPERRQLIAWRAPMKETFHVSEKFGHLELVNS